MIRSMLLIHWVLAENIAGEAYLTIMEGVCTEQLDPVPVALLLVILAIRMTPNVFEIPKPQLKAPSLAS